MPTKTRCDWAEAVWMRFAAIGLAETTAAASTASTQQLQRIVVTARSESGSLISTPSTHDQPIEASD
jgi:hypothetical protein